MNPYLKSWSTRDTQSRPVCLGRSSAKSESETPSPSSVSPNMHHSSSRRQRRSLFLSTSKSKSQFEVVCLSHSSHFASVSVVLFCRWRTIDRSRTTHVIAEGGGPLSERGKEADGCGGHGMAMAMARGHARTREARREGGGREGRRDDWTNHPTIEPSGTSTAAARRRSTCFSSSLEVSMPRLHCSQYAIWRRYIMSGLSRFRWSR